MSCHSSIIQYISYLNHLIIQPPRMLYNDTHSKVFLCISHIQTFHIIWTRCGPTLFEYMTIAVWVSSTTFLLLDRLGQQDVKYPAFYLSILHTTSVEMCPPPSPSPYNIAILLFWNGDKSPTLASQPCVHQQSDSWFQVHQPVSGTGPWDGWRMNCSGHWGGVQWEWLQ